MARLEIAKRELEDFVATRVWRRMVEDTIQESGNRQQFLVTADPALDATAMARCQGWIEALVWIIDRPAVLLEEIEYTAKTDKKREEENEDGNRR